MKTTDLEELRRLLERRLDTIADADLRERDPESQLARLQEVSEEIGSFHAGRKAAIPPRLDHFLGNCSFQKALEWVNAELEKGSITP